MTDSPHPIDIHVGRRLKMRRSLKGMSQERLGELLGLTFQQVQKYERGANRIGSSRLYEIAAILETSVAWFFDGLSDPSARIGAATAGFAEGPAKFDLDGQAPFGRNPCPTAEVSPVQTREALEMVRAFNRIGDPHVRRRLFELAKALAALSYRGVD